MVSTGLLKAGGIFHLMFAVFHVFWPKLFHWRENLKSLDDINKALLPIMSGLFIYLYGVVAIASFFYGQALLESTMGKCFVLSISGFWLIRTGMQVRYFDIKEKQALLFFFIFIVGVALYSIPVFL